MPDPFPYLFSSIAIGPYTLKNRIMNTGHAAHFQSGDGLPTMRYVDYLGERAKGGIGIAVTGQPQSHWVHRLPCSEGRCRTVGAYRRPRPVLRELPCLRLREDRQLRMPCCVAGGRVQGGGRVNGERKSLGSAAQRRLSGWAERGAASGLGGYAMGLATAFKEASE